MPADALAFVSQADRAFAAFLSMSEPTCQKYGQIAEQALW
jgi:hypothetical protein